MLTKVEEVNFLSGPGRGVILIKLDSKADRVLGFRPGQTLRATGWGMWRDVWNPIPNRIVDLGRTGGGDNPRPPGTHAARTHPLAPPGATPPQGS